jgi:hypothetical protein
VAHGPEELPVLPQALPVPRGQGVQPLAQVPPVQPEVAGEVAVELRQVRADVVLGEDEDVVHHAGEEAREELLLDLVGVRGHALDQVVGGGLEAVHVAVVDPVLDLVAVAPAELRVLPGEPAGRVLEEGRQVEGVVEPEELRELAPVARDGGVLHRPGEEGAVGLPGLGVGLPVPGLPPIDAALQPLLLEDVLDERLAERAHAVGEEDREAGERRRALVLEVDRLGPRQGEAAGSRHPPHLLRVRPEEAERPLEQGDDRALTHHGGV